MLRVREVTAEYSGMRALENASITLGDGEFVSIIGSNGAGKSTLLKAISGTVRCSSGEIYFGEGNITKMAAHTRTGLGIIHIPEGRRIFRSLSVIENLIVGAYRREARTSINGNLERVLKFFPILQERCNQLGGSLSGGEQQMLAIGRGLMAMPQILMLDEPSLGLSPRMADFIFDAIREMREKLKFSILLVEQRATEALELCDRGYILETGRITLSSNRENLIGNPLVQRAYLGTK
ncbi:MAG: ABC transporter ATP-binding protein [Thermodesulfobacteriota bacterium]|jgi:branched-chain amino acid transport system ATP-binding protein